MKKWNYRMVLAQRFPAVHQGAVDKLSNIADNGSQAYFRCYQKGLTDMIDKLPDKEKQIEEAKAIAKKWNAMGPPHDIQVR